MKRLSIILSTTLTILLFNACSISFGAITALDNSLHSDSNECEFSELSELENGTAITIALKDSTKLSGKLVTNEDSLGNGFDKVKIMSNENEIQVINAKEINKCTFIEEENSIWTGVFIGAAFDAILVLVLSNSNNSLMSGNIF